MAKGLSLRDLFVRIGFDADDAPLVRIDRGVTSLKSNLRTLRNVSIAMLGSGGIGGIFLKLAGEFEQVELSFEVMLGSAEEAATVLEELYDFAKTTPFEVKEVIGAAKQLKAFGFEVDELIPTLTRLGDVASGVVRPGDSLSQTFQRIALNFGQVRTATRLLGRDANQFAIAGIPIFKELAKVMGVAQSDVRKMGESGAISFDIVEQAFINMSGEGGQFFNLMQRQSKTFLGIWSNIRDVITLVAKDIGKTLLPQAKAIEIQFLKFLEVSKRLIIQKGKKIFEEIGKGMIFTIKIGKQLINALLQVTDVFGGLGNTIKGVTILLASMFALSTITAIGNITSTVFSLAKAFLFAGNSALLAQTKAALFPLAVGILVAAFGLLVEDVLVALRGGVSVTGKVLKKLEEAFPGIIEKIKEFGTTTINEFKSIISTVKIFINESAKSLQNWSLTTKKIFAEFAISAKDSIKSITDQQQRRSLEDELTAMFLVPFGKSLDLAKGFLKEMNALLLEPMKKSFESVTDFITLLLKKSFESVTDFITLLFTDSAKIILDTIGNMLKALAGLVRATKGLATADFGLFAKGQKEILESIAALTDLSLKPFKKGGKLDIQSDVFPEGGFKRLQGVEDAIKRINESLKEGGPLKELLNISGLGNFGTNLDPAFSTITPATSPVGPVNNTRNFGGATNTISLDAPISITVPPGTTPELIGPQVQQGVKDGLNEVLRETFLSTQPNAEF